MPNPNEVTFTRERLAHDYADCLNQNPLLARIEGQLISLGWSASEIRTAQMLTACHSNASLTQRLRELERRIAVIHKE